LKSYLKLFEDHGPLSLVSVDSASATKVTSECARSAARCRSRLPLPTPIRCVPPR
jgi:hypothetical protein